MSARHEYRCQYYLEHKKEALIYNRAYREKNKVKIQEWQRNYRQSHKSRQALLRKKWALKAHYGLTPADFDTMSSKQDNRCWACGEKKKLEVDHDHETGKARVLLCHQCNSAFGMVKENIKTMQKLIALKRKFNAGRHAQTL